MVLTLLAGVILLATLAGVLGAIKGDPVVRTATTTTEKVTTTTAVPAATLGKVGQQLDDLTAAGRRTEYHAIYGVTDPELPAGLEQTVELWREGDQFRFDTIERASNGTRRIIAVANGSNLRSCETVNGTQTCKVTNTPPADLPAAFVRTIVTASPKPTLTTRNDDIAGYQAMCFEAKDIGELCLTTDGVMLRLVLQGATVQATRVESAVPKSAFELAE
jgi:uncharacterized protein with beta-barrel porin domain